MKTLLRAFLRKLSWLRASATQVTILIIVFLLGIALFRLSMELRDDTGTLTFWGKLLHEVGFACWVAVIVGTIIEIGLARHIANEGLDAVMRASIPSDVWSEIRQHIVSQEVIRNNCRISMRIEPSADRYVSTTTFTYDLESRQDWLDYVVHNKLNPTTTFTEGDKTVPRYLRVRVGNDEWGSDNLERLQKDDSGKVDLEKLHVPLRFRSVGDKVKVTVQVREGIAVPGSRFWWATLTTRHLSLSICGAPSGYAANVIAFHPRGELLNPLGPGEWHFDGIMLPGQGIEIQFLPEKAQTAIVTTPTQTKEPPDPATSKPASAP